MTKKICLFKIGAIGDVLMTTPLVRAIRKKFPKAEIVYATSKWSAPVLKYNKDINRIIVFDNDTFYKKRVKKILQVIGKLKKEKFDLCFVLDKSAGTGLVCMLAGIPERIGFNRDSSGLFNSKSVEYKQVKHEIRYYLELVGGSDTSLRLTIGKKEEKWASAFMKKIRARKVIGIAPGGTVNPGESALCRRWSRKGYLKLAKMLIDKGYAIIFFGGPGDREYIRKIQKTLKKKTFSCAEKDLLKNAAVMKKCKLFITHDSGPMHMAAAVDTPVLSIFGPTHPKKKAPLGKKHNYLWVKELYSSNYEFYGKHGKKEKEITENDIKPEKVFRTAIKMV